ncbi:uncharacterized protein METZ01_LOCUS302242, partial [marine metagenome]
CQSPDIRMERTSGSRYYRTVSKSSRSRI